MSGTFGGGKFANGPFTVEAAGISGTGATLTIGNEGIASLSYTGSGVNTNLADAAASGGDIDTPDNWTTVASLAGKYAIDWLSIPGFIYPATMDVQSAEDSGDAIRIQLIRDSIIVLDAKVVADGAANHTVSLTGDETTGTRRFYCEDSFLLRATRVGTFTHASTVFKTGAIYYHTY